MAEDSNSFKLIDCVARTRLLADKLCGKQREEANSIASALASVLEDIAEAELETIKSGEE